MHKLFTHVLYLKLHFRSGHIHLLRPQSFEEGRGREQHHLLVVREPELGCRLRPHLDRVDLFRFVCVTTARRWLVVDSSSPEST